MFFDYFLFNIDSYQDAFFFLKNKKEVAPFEATSPFSI